MYKNIEDGKVFKRNGKVIWKCRNCGYLHEAVDAPELCPACLHSRSYFEMQGVNY